MIKQNRMYGTLLNPLYDGVDLDELCVAKQRKMKRL